MFNANAALKMTKENITMFDCNDMLTETITTVIDSYIKKRCENMYFDFNIETYDLHNTIMKNFLPLKSDILSSEEEINNLILIIYKYKLGYDVTIKKDGNIYISWENV